VLVCVAEIIMRVGLHICRYDAFEDYPVGWHYRFAVVDLDKAKRYPLNFVCMLPMQLCAYHKSESAFVRVFGDRSPKVAKQLLLEALEPEHDAEIRDEIERRLKLLEPKPNVEKRCLSCGTIFLAKPKHEFKQKYCPECSKKKFSSRRQ
jgi:hypothetical protein